MKLAIWRMWRITFLCIYVNLTTIWALNSFDHPVVIYFNLPTKGPSTNDFHFFNGFRPTVGNFCRSPVIHTLFFDKYGVSSSRPIKMNENEVGAKQFSSY